MPYNPGVQSTDPNALIAQMNAALRQMQAPNESPAMRDARLYYKHGLNAMEDPNGPNLQGPTGLAKLYGQGAAMKGAAKDAVKSAATSM